jgi:hypothetical protein
MSMEFRFLFSFGANFWLLTAHNGHFIARKTMEITLNLSLHVTFFFIDGSVELALILNSVYFQFQKCLESKVSTA